MKVILQSAWVLLLAGQAMADTLEERLSRIAETPAPTLSYTETRSSDLFSEPVIYAGRLEYESDTDILTKWIDTPEPARLAITGTHVEMQAGDGPVRRMAINRRPELGSFVLALRSLFRGEASALSDAFGIDYQTAADDSWNLVLRPRSKRVVKRVASLEIIGEGASITSIVTTLGSGERQRMLITNPPEILPGE